MTSTGLKIDDGVSPTKPSSVASQPRHRLWLVWFCVGLCILLGMALRAFHLGNQSLWYDEVEAIRYASDLSLQDVHPPIYYSLLHLTLMLGQSEWIVRFPSLLFGVLSIPLVYVIGNRLLSTSATLIATFLVSISPILIWHDQDARMYSLLVLTCLLLVYAYLRAIEKRDWKHWAGYTLAALLALYTQFYAILLLGTLGLHFLIFHRTIIRRWFLANALLALGYLPWLLVMIGLPEKKIGGAQVSALLRLPYNYFAFVNGYSLGPSLRELRVANLNVLEPYIWIIAPIFLVTLFLFVAGVDHLRRDNSEKLTLLLGWVFLPVLIAVAIPYVYSNMVFNVRYVLFSAPALLLILGAGIDRIRPRYLGTVLLTVFVFYNGMSLYNNAFDVKYAKEDVRGAAQYVTMLAEPDDHILVVTVGRVFDWYFHKDNLIIRNQVDMPVTDIVEQVAAGANSIWFVKARSWQTDSDNTLETLLDSRYLRLSTVEFPGVSVYHYCLLNCVGRSTG